MLLRYTCKSDSSQDELRKRSAASVDDSGGLRDPENVPDGAKAEKRGGKQGSQALRVIGTNMSWCSRAYIT